MKMKQFLLLIVAMLLTCCSKDSDVNAQEPQTPANGKVLVAYFSFTSNTKAYAEKIGLGCRKYTLVSIDK